jgi:hypothetical protein
MFHVMPEVSMAPLEELFGARVSSFLVKKELLPHENTNVAELKTLWHVKKNKKYHLTK